MAAQSRKPNDNIRYNANQRVEHTQASYRKRRGCMAWGLGTQRPTPLPASLKALSLLRRMQGQTKMIPRPNLGAWPILLSFCCCNSAKQRTCWKKLPHGRPWPLSSAKRGYITRKQTATTKHSIFKQQHIWQLQQLKGHTGARAPPLTRAAAPTPQPAPARGRLQSRPATRPPHHRYPCPPLFSRLPVHATTAADSPAAPRGPHAPSSW